jgi:short-subunit dehydrogenase
MSNSKITRFITENSTVSYPNDTSIQLSTQGHSLTIPDVVVKSIFAIGLVSIVYHVKDIAELTASTASSIYRGISRLFYKRIKTGTAVIYGATGKLGKAFALRFAEDGLGLVLIDYSSEKLAKLKEKIVQFRPDLEQSITCCELGKVHNLKDMQNDFNIKELYNALKKQKDITYLVNCRNIKQKEMEMFHKQKSGNIIVMTYYNMTVYAQLLKKILKHMSENHSGNIICLNNVYGNEKIIKETHPLFFATVQFAGTLTQILRLTYKDYGINFMAVNINYRNIATEKKYTDLVEYALKNIGHRNNIFT